jgi:hypothetical protein
MPANIVSTSQPRSAAYVPDDPAAFVALVERITNEADESALDAIYGDDVFFENLIDGAHDCYAGRAAVVNAWRAYMRGLAARGLRVRKRLITVSDDSIVNEWRGTIGAGRPVCGLEIWTFDALGKVREHRLTGSLAARRSTDPRLTPRLLVSYPLTTIVLLWHIIRSRALPNAAPRS